MKRILRLNLAALSRSGTSNSKKLDLAGERAPTDRGHYSKPGKSNRIRSEKSGACSAA